MNLREEERVLKVYHHHPTPFVLDVFKVIVGAFPFFLMLYFFQTTMSTRNYVLANLGIFLVFSLVIVYVSLIYWLDKLVITDQRIVHIDWKYLTVRSEAEALLKDIQDIQTDEKGFLSYFSVFDYGFLRLDTPSSYVTIEFYDAPDPEAIRKFIFHVKMQ